MFIFYAIFIFLIFHKILKCYSRVDNGKKYITISIRCINVYSTGEQIHKTTKRMYTLMITHKDSCKTQ